MYTHFKIATKTCITLICFLGFSVCCCSQTRVLRGKVTDQSGIPVAYASITFKGFSYGTRTDKNGNYKAVISPGYDSIVCTHVNYKRLSEKIDRNSVINLILEKARLSATIISIDTTLSNRSTTSFKVEMNESDLGEKYFEKVEIWACFPGGEKAFLKYLRSKLTDSLPNTFPKANGVVKYGFTISTDGTPKDFILLKGVNIDADAYVMQILTVMPKWVPAIQNGREAEQYREVIISLNIQ